MADLKYLPFLHYLIPAPVETHPQFQPGISRRIGQIVYFSNSDMCSIIIHQSLFIWAATLLNTNQNSGDSAMGLTEKPLNGLIKATTTTKNKSHQFRNVY